MKMVTKNLIDIAVTRKFPNFLKAFLFSFLFFISTPTYDSPLPLTNYQLSEVQCLTEMLWYEARGESTSGMLAVLQVLKNRKESTKYPDSYCAIVHQPRQFSYRNHLKPGQKLQIRAFKPLDKEMHTKVLYLSIRAVLEGFEPVLDPSALWYARKEVKKSWMKKMKRVVQIDSHSFYK